MAVDKTIRGYDYTVYRINFHNTIISKLTDEELKNKTLEFKRRLQAGESLEEILPEAYAVVKEAVKRFHPEHLVYHDVQLMGGIALNDGNIAELQTGEGKTITAALPAYLNALTGEGVHVVTTNDYLAERDYETLKPVYEALGLSVGLVKSTREGTREEDIARRKEAYSKDITYASSSAIVFDYERDNTATNKDDVVRSRENPGFAIVDEADKIFLDDAMIPYILSKSVASPKDEREVLEDQKKAKYTANANDFIYRIFRQDAETRRNSLDGRGLVRLFETKEQEDMELYGRTVGPKVDRNFLAIGSIESQSMSLTSRGWFEAFKYFNKKDIGILTSKMSGTITSDPSFVLGEDYVIGKYGLALTDKGLDKAVSTIPEFQKLNNDWYSKEETIALGTYLDNTLKAYFITEYGKDYGFINVGNKRKICSIVNGRMAEGRVYGGGLQEAIEAKEKTLARLRGDKIPIVDSKESVITASITQKSFYELYGKVGGMTGTSNKEIFEELYGFKTVEIPRHHGPTRRIEHPDTLFYSEEEKVAALVNEVMRSHAKGQPVLIATMSVEESKLVHRLLKARNIDAQLLNAEATDEEEARIVAQAGKKGSVTVTTQMAGRGTDIKLGGDTSNIKEEIIQRHVLRMTRSIAADAEKKTGKPANPDDYVNQVSTYLRNNPEAQKSINEQTRSEFQRILEEKERVKALGGLKLIGCGHFPLSRDDRQLIGRTARQNDPGETVFFTSIRDLEELHVPQSVIQELKEKHGLAEGKPISGEVVDKVVLSAQRNTEAIQAEIIANNHEKDNTISSLRNSIYRQRKSVLEDRVEPIDVLNGMVEGATSSIIREGLGQNSNPKATTKISKTDLDLQKVKTVAENMFGIKISDDITEKSTIKDLAREISEKAKAKMRDAGISCDKGMVLQFLDDYWVGFQQDLDFIRFERVAYALVQNKDYDEKSAIKRTYNEMLVKEEQRFVASVFGGFVEEKAVPPEAMRDLDKDRNNYNLYPTPGSEEVVSNPKKI